MEAEEAHKAAIESCNRVLNLICYPQDHQIQFRKLMVETEEAVFKFKKVVSCLNNGGLGHARVRKGKNINIPFPPKLLLDGIPIGRTTNNVEFPIHDVGSIGKTSLALGSSSNTLQLAQQTPQNLHFLVQQKHQQQQQLKQQGERMFCRSNSGTNLSFDSSTCTPTMSSTRSFISSLSVDGSVTNSDANAFHLIGASGSLDQNSYLHKRRCSARGDDGSVKCGSTRCHCSKKRLIIYLVTLMLELSYFLSLKLIYSC